jgi:hypothetical protein
MFLSRSSWTSLIETLLSLHVVCLFVSSLLAQPLDLCLFQYALHDLSCHPFFRFDLHICLKAFKHLVFFVC